MASFAAGSIREVKLINHKQRKYYRITHAGLAQLEKVKAKIVELYEEGAEKAAVLKK